MEVFWYFLDAARRRQGPVETQQIRGALHNGEVNGDTLIWREGMAEWKPLRQVEDFADMAAMFAAPRQIERPGYTDTRSTASLASADVVTTKFGTAHQVVYAGFWRRWAALFLDQIMILVPVIGLVIVIGLTGGGFKNTAGAAGLNGLYYFLYLLISPIYFASQEGGRHQATLGKRALGIKVTDMDGRPLSIGKALARWLTSGLSYLIFCIGYLMAAFTSQKQALHDVIMKTLVVDKFAFTKTPERQKQGLPALAIVFIVLVVLSVPLMGILAAISIPAYHAYTQKAKTVMATGEAIPVQELVKQGWARNGRCPVNGEEGIGTPESYESANLQSIHVGTINDSDRCGLQLTLKLPGRYDGSHIWLEYASSTNRWECTSDLPDSMLPATCRE